MSFKNGYPNVPLCSVTYTAYFAKRSCEMCSERDISGVLVVLLRDSETDINNDAVSS